MTIVDAIRANCTAADFVVDAYLADLQSQDLLARSVPGTNHIAWQLGHLIQSERYLVERCAPGSIDELPADFAARHGKEAAASDRAEDFLTKDEYLQLRQRVRSQALRLVEQLPADEFARPIDQVPPFLKTVGETLLFLGPHWLMHAGQWAIIRRKLGRPPLF